MMYIYTGDINCIVKLQCSGEKNAGFREVNENDVGELLGAHTKPIISDAEEQS